MNITEIEKLISLAGNLGIGAIIGGGITYLFLKSFLPSYFSKKAENLATKEDIASITDKVESVKTNYAKIIEELRTNNQLKLAEIEREKKYKKRCLSTCSGRNHKYSECCSHVIGPKY